MKRELRQGTLALVVPLSSNEKLGEAVATYASQGSCPSDCVFLDGGGCYAEDGPVGKFVTAPLNRAAGEADALDVARFEADLIDDLVVVFGRPLRLHVVGDCASDEAAGIVARAAERYMERGGGQAFTYTHAWRVVDRRSWGKVSVLASCETTEDVLCAHERGYATALVVQSFVHETRYSVHEKTETEAGRSSDIDNRTIRGRDLGHTTEASIASVSVVPCPAQTRGIPCTKCRLCFRDDARLAAGVTIGFAIHGTPLLQRKARKALADPGDPDRKLTSRQLIPRFQEQFRAEHGREPNGMEIARALDLSPGSVYEMLKSIRLGGPARPARRGRRSRT